MYLVINEQTGDVYYKEAGSPQELCEGKNYVFCFNTSKVFTPGGEESTWDIEDLYKKMVKGKLMRYDSVYKNFVANGLAGVKEKLHVHVPGIKEYFKAHGYKLEGSYELYLLFLAKLGRQWTLFSEEYFLRALFEYQRGIMDQCEYFVVEQFIRGIDDPEHIEKFLREESDDLFDFYVYSTKKNFSRNKFYFAVLVAYDTDLRIELRLETLEGLES